MLKELNIKKFVYAYQEVAELLVKESLEVQ